MPEYLSPGVYVEEIEIGSKPVEGVSTSTAGFLGETERGPTTPQFVTSWLDYQRVFGSYFSDTGYLPYSVQGFFDNGGQRAYIARVTRATAVRSELRLKKGAAEALLVEAIGEGSWGNRIAVKVVKGTFSGFKLSVYYWKQEIAVFDPETDTKKLPRPAVAEQYDNLSLDAASPDYYEKKVNGISNLVSLSAVPGKTIQIPDVSAIAYLAGGADSDEADGSPTAAKDNTITLSAEASAKDGDYVGMELRIIDGPAKGQVRTITGYVGSTKVATVSGGNWDAAATPTTGSVYRIVSNKLVLADFVRADSNQPGQRKGLTALDAIDDISLLYSPNASVVTGLVGELISHSERLRDRFVILDSPVNAKADSLDPRSANETKYAAFYYPWIKVVNPDSGLLRIVPPGGHVLGLYARTDVERGVHKAPANDTVRGAVDLEFQITKGEQDVLNPKGVNVIRAFPGRGIRVWGARTLSSDPLWKYVNVRRLFLYLEESVFNGTQWVVFEPNDDKLWARVRRTVTEFLTRLWRDGALQGRKPEEAFFVKVDRSTMTQDDINNGRLIVLIGVAPVKPAEFVIFRIAQVSGGADAAE
ncbi:Phage tail sheath protein FI-like protein [Paenibacillus curdlanolyticus YK9]|uniref:Phage tail sheath protein FI-like protein n=1 Tax=Paenibacillus curdlanolyticus YK9 TaxID=717606 RepID=E0I827_9BACL|nr:phage tail sheath family protein [Paenibacillus curdlanolyticus]EFM11332.1 Phage tail sheath protein FI-like protein [Paenibacillus curdlanolyticus YK9]